MKKAFLSLLLVASVAVAAVISCKKVVSNPTTVINSSQSLNQLFARLRYMPQSLSVQAGRDTVVCGTNGTLLHFYVNSFKTATGNVITSGTINLQLVEMYKARDIICNRASTMANGKILSSGGQVSINASMDGQTVYTNGYGIGFPHANSSGTHMALFYGGTGNDDSVTTWSQSDTTNPGNVAHGTTADSTSSGHGAAMFIFDSCTNFTYINCDCFYNNDSPKTSVNIILPDTTFNPGNTQVFVVLHNISVWGSIADTTIAVLTSYDNTGSSNYVAATNTLTVKTEGQTNTIPAGLNYELVVITNKNGQFYYWETTGVVPHNGIIVNAALAPESQSDIASRLLGL